MQVMLEKTIREKKVSHFKSICIATIIVIAVSFFCIMRGIEHQHIVFKSLLAIIVYYCIKKGIDEKSIINPYLLFSLTPITLLIYDVSVSQHYLVELEDITYIIAIYNFVAIITGMVIMQKIKIPHNKELWSKGINLSQYQYSKNAYLLLFFGLFPTFWGSLTGIEYLTSMDLNGLKEAVNLAPLSSIISLFLYPAMVCALKSKRKKTVVICFLGMAFSIIFNFSKTTIAMMCLTILVTYYDRSLKEKKGRMLFLVILVISIVVLYMSFDIYNNIRHDYDTSNYFQDLGYVGNIQEDLFLPYMYLITPWSNLQYVMETVTEHTYGLWIIKPILGYLQIDGLLKYIFDFTPRYSAFNTFSFISPFYSDFGIIGSGLCSFLFGMFLMWIYKWYIRFKESPFVVATYSLNVYSMLMLFFNNHYFQLSYPFTILLLMWIWSKLIKNNGR